MYRVFHKTVKGVRNLYPVDKIYDVASEQIEKDPNSDYYESIYIYDSEAYNQLKKTKSLAGIRNIKTDRLVWDFDSEDNIEKSLADTKELIDRILPYFNEENVRVFFSGGKGWHVEVHLTESITRDQFEKIINNFAGDLETFDTTVKDQQRLFRFPLTKNVKTGLIKIPLTFEELDASVEEIKSFASEENIDFDLRSEILNSYEVEDLPEELRELSLSKSKKEEVNKEVDAQDFPDMSRKPKHLTAAKYVLQEGFFNEGERNEACMILATTYKYLGYNKETTYNIIKATLRLRQDRLGLDEYDKEELWNTIVNPVYSPTWKGGTYTEEDGLLKTTIERYKLNKLVEDSAPLVNLQSLANQFSDFATNIDANTIKLGIDEIDNKIRITTSSLVAFLAAPSAGKSSISFGILNTISKSGESATFFSMDMSIPQVFQRIIQRHTAHDENVIMDNYKNGNTKAIREYENIMSNEYSNVKFCFRAGLTPKDVRDTLNYEFQNTGKMPRLVILDYLECMRSSEGITDSNQSKASISTELKGIANELGVCIILLVQPRMSAGGPAGELNSYTDIKGSSVISESAAQVLTMSRPGFDPKNTDNDEYVTINVVKNRLGKLSSTDLHWTGLTGNIRSLSDEERKDLAALRAEIAKEKSAKNDRDLY